MAFELHQDKEQFPVKAGTDIIPRSAVKLGGTSVLLAIPIATAAEEPFGVTHTATYLGSQVDGAADQAAVYFRGNVMKMKAAGSVGAGADVFVASTNQGVGPSGIITASAHWIIGKTVSAAAAGEVVSVYVNPRRA